MDSSDHTSEILLILPELSRRLRPRRDQAGDRSRLSLAQIKAMTHLAQCGQQTMTELARGLDISLPAATDLVDRLLAANLVERIRDDRDRRIVLVRLSGEAAAHIEPVMEYRRRAVQDVLVQLDTAEQEAFLKGLRLLAESLTAERHLLAGHGRGDE